LKKRTRRAARSKHVCIRPENVSHPTTKEESERVVTWGRKASPMLDGERSVYDATFQKKKNRSRTG